MSKRRNRQWFDSDRQSSDQFLAQVEERRYAKAPYPDLSSALAFVENLKLAAAKGITEANAAIAIAETCEDGEYHACARSFFQGVSAACSAVLNGSSLMP